jgi:methionyl-tRNA synthetase
VAKANKYIDDTAPWALNKDESRRGELASVMSHLANVLFVSGMLLNRSWSTLPKSFLISWG